MGKKPKKKKPMIHYCLDESCDATKMYGDPDKEWRVSKTRTGMIMDGTADFMMAAGGFCPKHRIKLSAT